MKKILIVILVISLGIFIYYKSFSLQSIGDRIFDKIEDGKLDDSSIRSGSLFVLSDDFTDLKIESYLLSMNDTTSIGKENMSTELFNFPKSIRKHEFIESRADTTIYLSSYPVGVKWFNKNLTDVVTGKKYKSRKDFVEDNLKLFSSLYSAHYDSINEIIIYKVPTIETTFKYKIQTPTENYILNLIFAEQKDSKKKLAGIYVESK